MFRNEARRPVISEEPQSRVVSPNYGYHSSHILPRSPVLLLHAMGNERINLQAILESCHIRTGASRRGRGLIGVPQLHETLAPICNQLPLFSIDEEALLKTIVIWGPFNTLFRLCTSRINGSPFGCEVPAGPILSEHAASLRLVGSRCSADLVVKYSALYLIP